MAEMMNYDTLAFAELNDFAAKITRHNEEYAVAGCNNKKFEHVAKNEIAVEQTELVGFLGDMSDALPYEQLGIDYLATEAELEAAKLRRETIDEENGTAKLAVNALANRLAGECYFELEAAIEDNRADRHREINAQNRDELEQRIADLTHSLGQLTTAIEVAGEAWPIPTASSVPTGEDLNPETTPGIQLSESSDCDFELRIVDIDDEFATELEQNTQGEYPDRRHGEHKIDQPHASELIALHLVENVGKTVTAEELVEVLYGHCDYDEDAQSKLRGRVVVHLAPQTHSKVVTSLMQELGNYKLQFGWRKYMTERPDGRIVQATRKVRVYRAVQVASNTDELPEFNDRVMVDKITADSFEDQLAA